MPEVSLSTLRDLRSRARKLLGSVSADLAPFVNSDGTFRRTPDSLSKTSDVNVTTTCSCLMALALTNSFKKFFKSPFKGGLGQDAAQIFRMVVNAPWMSSGLTANNAFTTTLVIRAYGFLEQEGLLKGGSRGVQAKLKKDWDVHLGISGFPGLIKLLKQHPDPASEFLWLSLTDKTRDLLKNDAQSGMKLKSAIAVDVARITESGWIYEPQTFGKASAQTKELLDAQRVSSDPNAYKLAEANRRLLLDQFPEYFAGSTPRTLKAIATELSADADNFSINKYPPSAAVLYWFVDGVGRAKISLSPKNWTALCNWAAAKFNHQRSLVAAEHDAMMDPVAMGMSACLCARLRSISGEAKLGTTKAHAETLPSMFELQRSISDLMGHLADSGIFPKYFPMFHYQDAGSNFCFTFELLEAVLYEFGDSEGKLLGSPAFIDALEKAITWCEDNRLEYSATSGAYTGWNSGGYLDTLEKEQPESWATAVVHMFLSEIDTVVSRRIQQLILEKYKARPSSKIGSTIVQPATKSNAIDKLLDIEVILRNKPTKLSSLLTTRLIDKYKSKDELTLRRESSKDVRSALLFGPPGTSKTRLIEAISTDLGWPMIELTPSEFVKGSLAKIYLQADEIFEDLMDMSGVVVFFDEMDALVQTRDGASHLDIESQFLTTTMLPKLTRLYDRAQVVFFMATNFQDRFDAAIKRPGRFDLLLCMGPPILKDKIDRLHVACSLDAADAQTSKAGACLKKYLEDSPELQDQLTLFTFGEYKSFLKTFGSKNTIGDKIEKLGKAKFCKRLRDYNQYVTLKLDDLSVLQEIGVKWNRLAELDKKPFSLKQLADKIKGYQPTPIIRYLCDRKESRDQS